MISRRRFIAGVAGTGVAAIGAASFHFNAVAQSVQSSARFADAEPWAETLIAAAMAQIGVTTVYDPAYAGLNYPMGDIPRKSGVCTDVVIRAYRDAHDIDLQKLVHEDMKSAFGQYPKTWGLKRPDRNIDHRRVPNLERFFVRQEADLPISDRGTDYRPGDLVSQRLPGNLPHIAIVTDHAAPGYERPLVVHNIGAGTRLEDRLFDFPITGHFRFAPNAV